MFLERENIFEEYVMHCGCKYRKLQGLFKKFANQRGIDRSDPLDLIWTIQIRRGQGEREQPARTVTGMAAVIADGKGARQ